MTIKEHIMSLLEECNELSVNEIVQKTGSSKQMAHVALRQLLVEKKVLKIGKVPKTSYRLRDAENDHRVLTIPVLSDKENSFLDQHCLLVNNEGHLLRGVEAFAYRCLEKEIPFEKALSEFTLTVNALHRYYGKKGRINATEILLLNKAFGQVWVDDLFYLDFEEIKPLGRTPLATLVHYAKTGQSDFMMNILIEEITEKILAFVKEKHADAIAYVPPTLGRGVQLIKFLKNNLNIPLPLVEIKKVDTLIPLSQNSIAKIENKIKNADNTYVVSETRHFKHLIIIDDTVDTGATLNQISGKIKLKGIAAEITALAIVGSFKGFDAFAGDTF
jgi:hypothetical protein